jgi:hypothetical protein
MSAKPLSLAVLLSLVAAFPADAQQPMPAAPMELNPAPVPAPAPAGSANAVLSNGLTPLPNTAGARWVEENASLPVGRNGPIGQESYLETGPTMPKGDGVFGLYLQTGWMVEGGFRALFFNAENSAAMTARVGLTYQENFGKPNAPTYKFFGTDVRTKALIRVSGVTAIGRDWFRPWNGRWNNSTNTFRFGADVGARWGTEILSLDVENDPVQNTTFRHRSDVFGGVVVGVHADVEVPMRSWVWFGGLRWEFGYNWSNLLPGQNSNIFDFNTLLATGFRY